MPMRHPTLRLSEKGRNTMAVEDAIIVHKNEVVFCDKSDKERYKHYRLTPDNLVKIVFDYATYKRFFGLKKELEERIIFYVNDPDIPEELIVCEHKEENFRRFRGGLRTFVDDNKVKLEIYDVEGKLQ